MIMLLTHADAERRYSQIRKIALKAVSNQVSPNLKLDFKLIDKNALNACDKWSFSSNRLVDWDWNDGYASFKFRYPKGLN